MQDSSVQRTVHEWERPLNAMVPDPKPTAGGAIWGAGYVPLKPHVGLSQAPLTSPCPPSNHDLCTPTQIKTEGTELLGGNVGYGAE